MSQLTAITASALTCLSILSVEPVIVSAEESRFSASEDKIIRLTDEFRNEQGLSELSRSQSLTKAARDFANFMLAESKYGHYADGRRPSERAEDAGYDYCVVSENIAYRVDSRQPDASEIGQHFFEGWKESEEHRENMLGAHISETGVAVATDDGKTFYAVQMFGRPASAKFKFQIKNETDANQVLIFRSEDSRDEISVPPSTILTVSRCIETTVLLQSGDEKQVKVESKKTDRITVKKSGVFIITYDENRKPVLRSI